MPGRADGQQKGLPREGVCPVATSEGRGRRRKGPQGWVWGSYQPEGARRAGRCLRIPGPGVPSPKRLLQTCFFHACVL